MRVAPTTGMRASGGRQLLSVTLDDGVQRVEARLGVLVSALKDLREPNGYVHEALNDEAERAFKRGGPMFDRSARWVAYENEPNYEARKRGILFPHLNATKGGPRRTTVKFRNGLPYNAVVRPSRVGATRRLAILRWTAASQRSPWAYGERLGPSFSDTRSPWHVFINSRRGFVWGSSLDYAAQHQYGGGRQKWDGVPVPRRPIIGPAPIVVRQIARIYQSWIAAAVDGGIGAARSGLLTRADLVREFGP